MEELKYGSLEWVIKKMMNGAVARHNTFRDYEYVEAEGYNIINQDGLDMTSSIQSIQIYKNGWELVSSNCDHPVLKKDTPAVIRLYEYPLYDIGEKVWIIRDGKIKQITVKGHRVAHSISVSGKTTTSIEYLFRSGYVDNTHLYASKADVIANGFEERK